MSNVAAHIQYREAYDALTRAFGTSGPRVGLQHSLGSDVQISRHQFISAHWDVHPEEGMGSQDPTYRALVAYYLEQNPHSYRHFFRELHSPDREIPENREFEYYVFAPPSAAPHQRATLLLHGLNEKSWSKYLPWALRLTELTGAPVILFPIAFHMNRAPAAWSHPREMMQVVKERRRLFPGLAAGSFANAALSHRVQFAPHRFLTSGLQSFNDVVDLVANVVSGSHPVFARNARVDIFAYSVGVLLAQVLLMRNPHNHFAASRAFFFAGGAVLDAANPVSKTIMDAQAYQTMTRFLGQLAAAPDLALPELKPLLARYREEIDLFRCLLFTDHLRDERERAIAPVADRLQGLLLERDRVFSPAATRNSWQTTQGSSRFQMEAIAPAYEYTHEQPFPVRSDNPDAVHHTFETVMEHAAHHLG